MKVTWSLVVLILVILCIGLWIINAFIWKILGTAIIIALLTLLYKRFFNR